jgi:cell division protein FtsQ
MKVHPVIRERVLPAVAAGGVVAVLAVGAWQGYTVLVNRPVKHIVFHGDVSRLPAAVLDEFARELGKRTVGTSLASIRENARRIPWVREATVRRRFPDTIEISFEAYDALARWNDKELVSPRGEVFSAQTDAPLPTFRGPEGAAATMVSLYPQLVAALAPVGSAIAELHLSARGAWDVALASGLHVVLGREDVLQRARRFAAAWPQVVARGVETKYADLRYPNGFALRQAVQVIPTKKRK